MYIPCCWKRIWSLKVLEFSIRGPWKYLVPVMWKIMWSSVNYKQYSEHQYYLLTWYRKSCVTCWKQRWNWFATRKPSCRWQTRATPAKSLHGLRKSSGVVVSCIASLLIDSVPMAYYYVLYSNCVCKMRRFGDIRLLKLPWPWNPGQGSLKVIESDTIR